MSKIDQTANYGLGFPKDGEKPILPNNKIIEFTGLIDEPQIYQIEEKTIRQINTIEATEIVFEIGGELYSLFCKETEEEIKALLARP